MTPGRVWVTGFEAFGELERNPTAWLVDHLPEQLAGHALACELLPVSYREVTPLLAAILDDEPALWLGLGVRAGAAALELEQVGLNLDDARLADNRAERRQARPIQPGAPAAHLSTLPLSAIRERLRGAGIPARISRTAGAFLCNHVLFAMLDGIAARGLSTRAGFLHVPLSPEQAARAEPPPPSMSAELQLAGVLHVLEQALAERGAPLAEALT